MPNVANNFANIVANIVVGKDGATTCNGHSGPLSSGLDRDRFHRLRERADLILIGGETSRREPYRRTPVPLAVLSRRSTLSGSSAENPQAFLIQAGIAEAIGELREKYKTILMECGATLLAEALNLNLVNELYITRSHATGEGPYFRWDSLEEKFTLVIEERSPLGQELFLHYARLPGK
jgi:riboflavin biosynthesis pyrimidine reductase